MMEKNDHTRPPAADPAEELLQQLFHLKRYGAPDAARMAKNKQNIMRQVREIKSRKRRSVTDLLVVNVPWFFAEPRYGIAALFIVFATLQFWGANTQKHVHDNSDIYTRDSGIALTAPVSAVYTNRSVYPELPEDLNLFHDKQTDSGIRFVGRRID